MAVALLKGTAETDPGPNSNILVLICWERRVYGGVGEWEGRGGSQTSGARKDSRLLTPGEQGEEREHNQRPHSGSIYGFDY